jgi:hypothetical protein
LELCQQLQGAPAALFQLSPPPKGWRALQPFVRTETYRATVVVGVAEAGVSRAYSRTKRTCHFALYRNAAIVIDEHGMMLMILVIGRDTLMNRIRDSWLERVAYSTS